MKVEKLSPLIATLTFFGVAAVLIVSLFDFQRTTIEWAERDLNARVKLAASHLKEPLQTQNMRAVHEFADDCREKGYRLRILTNGGGVFFDSVHGATADLKSYFSCAAQVDGFTIILLLPPDRVLAPYNRALPLFLLSALVGVLSMLFVFFAFYRQRARIRAMARQERERMKFITDFTHELKTPLTGIIGAVDLMDENDPLGKIVKQSAERLDQLAMDLIDFHYGKK